MAIFEKEILRTGEYYKKGHGLIEVTRNDLRHYAKTFSEMRNEGFSVPVSLEHPDDEDPASHPLTKLEIEQENLRNGVGFVEKMRLKDGFDKQGQPITKLMTVIDVPNESDAEKVGTTIRAVSPSFGGVYTDYKERKWKNPVWHVALTNHPVNPVQEPFRKMTKAVAMSSISERFTLERAERVNMSAHGVREGLREHFRNGNFRVHDARDHDVSIGKQHDTEDIAAHLAKAGYRRPAGQKHFEHKNGTKLRMYQHKTGKHHVIRLDSDGPPRRKMSASDAWHTSLKRFGHTVTEKDGEHIVSLPVHKLHEHLTKNGYKRVGSRGASQTNFEHESGSHHLKVYENKGRTSAITRHHGRSNMSVRVGMSDAYRRMADRAGMVAESAQSSEGKKKGRRHAQAARLHKKALTLAPKDRHAYHNQMISMHSRAAERCGHKMSSGVEPVKLSTHPKFKKVMGEFKSGQLTSNGSKVTRRRQALAIAFSEVQRVQRRERKRQAMSDELEMERLSKLRTGMSDEEPDEDDNDESGSDDDEDEDADEGGGNDGSESEESDDGEGDDNNDGRSERPGEPEASGGGEDGKLASIREQLARLDIVLPEDTDKSNFEDRLLTALLTYSASKGIDDDPTGNDGDDSGTSSGGSTVQEESGPMTQMSATAKGKGAGKGGQQPSGSNGRMEAELTRMKRKDFSARIDACLASGQMNADTAKKLKDDLVAKYSFSATGEDTSSAIDDRLGVYEGLPKGAFWSDEERVTQMSVTEQDQPGFFKDPTAPMSDEDADKVVEAQLNRGQNTAALSRKKLRDDA